VATFYVDFENGNDANDGTTFANRWKTLTNGATAARIGPGDEIRMMGSPNPTSLGINATWTSGQQQTNKTVTGATNATPISITCVAHGYSTGDTVVLASVGGNTSANGVWEITVTGTDTFTLDGSVGNAAYTSGGTVKQINNAVVRLASPLTATIASTGMRTTAWTASANVTTSLTTTNTKEHYVPDLITIGTSFTTGKAAYFATGALDLSGYQQVSFWIYQAGGTIGAAGAIDIRLCSDTTGDTAVNTISVPNLATTGVWCPITVDLGTNLGSSIQSIALYVNTDNGSQQFLLSNIIACKASSAADSLTLTSLIGKNVTGETFWPIQSIKGTRVLLDLTLTTQGPTAIPGYYGTSETCTTYKREAIKLGPTSTSALTLNDSGTEGNPITYTGGWDRTAMTTQNLQTWLDGLSNIAAFTTTTAQSYISISNVALTRFSGATSLSGAGGANNFMNWSFISVSACSNFGPPAAGSTVRFGHFVGGQLVAFNLRTSTYIIDYLAGCSSTAQIIGLEATAAGGTSSAVIANSTSTAVLFNAAGTVRLSNLIFNTSIAINQTTTQANTAYLDNCKINSATFAAFTASRDAIVYSSNHDQVAGANRIEMEGGVILSAVDQRHTASGISWKMQPTNSSTRNSLRPVILSLAKVACGASALVTIKAWMRRDNTGLTMRLVCKGGQISGVTSDVTSSMTAAADTWEELTITFTPSVAGVVEITAEAWGGTTYSGWVDDMTISQ
jgi:hypothetical protein